MKKYFALLPVILLSTTTFCQIRLAEEYKTKSRHLMNAGLVLIGVGGAMTISGTVLIAGDKSNVTYDNNTLSSRSQTGALLIAAGITSTLGSIPLFIVSRALHKKASRIMRASTFLEIEKVPSGISFSGIPLQPFPALGFRLSR